MRHTVNKKQKHFFFHLAVLGENEDDNKDDDVDEDDDDITQNANTESLSNDLRSVKTLYMRPRPSLAECIGSIDNITFF